MKMQCEVCTAEAASIFCCADEAAFCESCDRRVHGANRLAGKHHRFSLLQPSSTAVQSPPLCDVCKEKRGFVFCQEDRAILCRDCDLPIHSATPLTMKHSRFLLTGVRVSAIPITSSPAEEDEVVDIHGSNVKANSSSSISEYLIKTLPGWHIEDFLNDLCKTEEEDEPFYGMNTSNSVLNGSGGALPIRLPQAPSWVRGDEGIGFEEVEMQASSNKLPWISVRYL